MKRSVLIVAVVFLALASVSVRTSAQAPPPANDVNAALIRELHDLRLAIEKLASSTSRVQVLSARASQQEQLVSSLTSQLVTLNSKLTEAGADTSFTNATLEQLKDRLRIESDPQRRTVLEEQQAGLTADLNRKRLMQSLAQAQTDAVRQQIAVAQSNLADLQRRLDDLDRSLTDSQK
jgi:hypothetical protein